MQTPPQNTPSAPAHYAPHLALLGAVVIWAGWMVQTRHLSLGHIPPVALTAIRFSFAALFLLPITLRRGLLWKGVALAATFGAPYMLLVSKGMELAPASHGATFVNGTLILVTFALSVIFLNERPRPRKISGLLLLLLGLGLLWAASANGGLTLGHLLFTLGGVLWAIYSFLIKKWKLDPLHATAMVATYSALLYLPVYLVFFSTHIEAGWEKLLFIGFYQGVLSTGVALSLFSYGVSKLGSSVATLYMPLVPALTVVLGSFLLGEVPSMVEGIAIGAVLLGFALSRK